MWISLRSFNCLLIFECSILQVYVFKSIRYSFQQRHAQERSFPPSLFILFSLFILLFFILRSSSSIIANTYWTFLPCARHGAKFFNGSSYLILTITSGGEHSFDSHFFQMKKPRPRNWSNSPEEAQLFRTWQRWDSNSGSLPPGSLLNH